jgi:hypothetical protein
MFERILANAIVDVEREPRGGGLGRYRVEVWGKEPHDYTRVYTIDGKSDTIAAQEGLRRFVEEIEDLLAKKE